MRNADLALYSAKNGGRGTFRFFAPELHRVIHARRNLERDIRNALAGDEFELYYQPIVDLRSGSVSGCEALLRWNHPERGLILPSEFIPLTEETGAIVPLGDWVLRTACAEAAKWAGDMKVAINLSAAQFRSKDLVSSVVSALTVSGLSHRRLELEVTETSIVNDSDTVFGALRELQELGIQIALDDFGTGHSSLSTLKKFPFDKIKIDRSFVNELMSGDEDLRAIARAVVRFAVSLGKTTTAEGVETKEQLEILSAENCTQMQGYFFSKPVRSRETTQIFSRDKKPANAA